MAYYRNRGAELPEQETKRRKKPITKRWWFWVLVLVAAVSLWNRFGGRAAGTGSARRTEPTATAAPRSTPRPTAKPSEKPTETATPEADEAEASPEPEAAPEPEPTEAPLSQTDIRPEFREFVDSYEDFMDEYIEFMTKYEKADAASAALMLVEYGRLMERYAEFGEKLNALDEREYTTAEWAYYLEVTNRVNQKMLRAVG